jgi:nucleotide-binding universal stress UspA family protein
MKILATFDGTPFSESTLPLVSRMAALPDTEFILLAIAHEPGGRMMRGARHTIIVGAALGSTTPVIIQRPQTPYAETKEQAIDRRRAELEDYLLDIAGKLPPGTKVHVEAHIGHAAKTIIECVGEEQPDVIVMATHSRTGLPHLLFGSTTEEVVRSGVAPVLVVHPTQPTPSPG